MSNNFLKNTCVLINEIRDFQCIFLGIIFLLLIRKGVSFPERVDLDSKVGEIINRKFLI